MFTFVSVIHQNFEYNLRILANFSIKTQKSMDFACTFSKSYSFFFFGFFKKDYTFYTKKSIFYNERCSKFRENQLFSNIFTFLSVIRQDFEYNLRILANFRIKTQTSMISPVHFQKTTVFLDFLIKIILLH